MKAKSALKSKLLLLGIASMIIAQSLAPAVVLADDHCRKLGVPIMGVRGVCQGESPDGEKPDIHNGNVYADNVIFAYMIAAIRFLSVGIGLVITLMIVVSGIQYVSSAGNSQKIEAAKTKLRHAVEALVLFIFLSAIVNWLIPGGVL